jgi:hypothetical protein
MRSGELVVRTHFVVCVMASGTCTPGRRLSATVWRCIIDLAGKLKIELKSINVVYLKMLQPSYFPPSLILTG